jgi:predicted nucleotidyltransferase
MSKSEVKKIIARFIKKLDDNKYAYTAIYLYGSHATNKSTEFSDIDIAVFSKDLHNWWNEQIKLGRLSLTVDSRIEPKIFDKDELKNPKDPFVIEIKEHGIRVV